ncbi:MAG: hypothetical protein K8R21_12050 [Leptospira sp.]|nr:hypothetical protein [Leptospira sp.]
MNQEMISDNNTGWLSEEVFQLEAEGVPPVKVNDFGTAKLLACQDARNFAISVFNQKFFRNLSSEKNEHFLAEQKFTKDFGKNKIEIITMKKENDKKGNCTVLIQFKGNNLKSRLETVQPEFSTKEKRSGWE